MLKTHFHIKALIRCSMVLALAVVLFMLGPGCGENGNGNTGTQDTINVEQVEKKMIQMKELEVKLKKSEEDLRAALHDLENDSLKL